MKTFSLLAALLAASPAIAVPTAPVAVNGVLPGAPPGKRDVLEERTEASGKPPQHMPSLIELDADMAQVATQTTCSALYEIPPDPRAQVSSAPSISNPPQP